MCLLKLVRDAQALAGLRAVPGWVAVLGRSGRSPCSVRQIPSSCPAPSQGAWRDPHSPPLPGCSSDLGPSPRGRHRRGFVSKGSSFPSFPPAAFFIGFWLGIRHVLTEQTFCYSQNPPLRRRAISLLCRCLEPVPGWGKPSLGLGQPFQAKAEAFQVASRTGAGAWLRLSAPLQSVNRFCSNIPPWGTGGASEDCCPPATGLWRVPVAPVSAELRVPPACLPVSV